MTQKETYPKNFLSSVIFRIDFPDIVGLVQEPIQFHEKIKSEFPLKEGRVVSQFSTSFNPSGAPASITQINDNIWDYFSSDKVVKVTLNKNFLVVETFKYSSFEHFSKIITLTLQTFLSLYGVIQSLRVGLRYSNKITLSDGHPLVWGNNLNPQTVAAISLVKDNNDLRRFINQSIIKGDDDITMNVVYGMHNPEFPGRISRKEFLIDLDCFSEEPKSITDILATTLQMFHDKISTQFELLIDDGLRIKMRNE